MRDVDFCQREDCWDTAHFLLLEVQMQEVVHMLGRVLSSEEQGLVRNGEQVGDHVRFDMIGASPDLVFTFTKELHTIGYAGVCGRDVCTRVAKNGGRYGGYVAEWDKKHVNGPLGDRRYSAYVVLTDVKTGAKFYTGGLIKARYEYLAYTRMVRKHTRLCG